MYLRRFLASYPLFSLFAIAVLSICFVQPLGNFPIGDDWQYAYPVKSWIENGGFEFKGIFAPNTLLQIIWGFLFCKIGGAFSFDWLRLSTMIASAIGLIYFFKILKQSGLSNKVVFLPLLALTFNPLLYYLSFTFFTDIPFLTLCIISIYCFQKYILHKNLKHFVWAVFWAIAAFYIRQPGLLLIPAFAASVLLIERFSKQALLITAALALITLGVYFSLENLVKPALGISDNFVPVGDQLYLALMDQPLSTILEWGKKAIKTFIYLGFFGLPFIPIYWKKITEGIFTNRRLLTIIFLANAGLFALLLLIGKTFPFGGNILFNFGLGSELLADVYTLGLSNTPKLPNWTMLFLQFVSQLSATFLFAIIIKTFKTLKKEQQRFILFLLLFNAIYIPIMSITSFFDRYLLITIVSFFIVLSMGIRKEYKLGWNLMPLIFIAGFSILATKDFMAWNRSKNAAFQYLTEKGISITEIDAGYEYNGFYNYHYPREEKEGKSFWWVSDNKYMITFGAVEGYHVLASFPYYRCLFFRENSILVLERDN